MLEAIKLKPDQPMAHYDLGLLLRSARRHGERPPPPTKPRSRRSPKLYQPHFNLAKILSRDRRREGRGTHFRAAVEANPAFGTGYLYLAKALLDTGDLRAPRRRREGPGVRSRAGHGAARPLRARRRLLAAGTRARSGAPGRGGQARRTWRQMDPAADDVDPRCSWLAALAAGLLARCAPGQTARARCSHAACCSSPSTRFAPIASASTAARTSRRRTWIVWPARARWPARVGARAADAAVARLALHRALPGRARHPRQRVAAAARRTCRCSPRSCSSAGSRTARVRVLDRAVEAVGTGARVRALLRQVRDRRRRCAVPEHDPEARRHRDRPRRSRGSQASIRRRFAWVHLYDPHDPYEPPEPYASRYADRPYDGEVAWSDELVGRLDAVLARAGAARQHAGRRHLRPRRRTRRARRGGARVLRLRNDAACAADRSRPRRDAGNAASTRVTRSVDVMPTVLDLLGSAARHARTGVRPDPGGGACAASAIDDEPTFAESLVPLIHYGWSDLRALRDGRWKYILAPRPELYDLERDPARAEEPGGAGAGARARAARRGSRSGCGWSSSAARSDAAAGRGAARSAREARRARLRQRRRSRPSERRARIRRTRSRSTRCSTR